MNPEKGARLVLDEKGLSAARRSLDQGGVVPSYGPWREDIIKLLNDALATELVCVMRYKRHYFTATGLASPKIAEEFLVHANDEVSHGDQIAERIAIEAYTQMIHLIGDKDSTTRRILEGILSQEQEHAEDLRDWMTD